MPDPKRPTRVVVLGGGYAGTVGTHRRRLRCEERASKPRPPVASDSRLASSHLNLRVRGLPAANHLRMRADVDITLAAAQVVTDR
jgi:hypothetical protein